MNDTELIDISWIEDENVHHFLRNEFKKLDLNDNAIILAESILTKKPFNCSLVSNSARFYQYNMSKFDENKTLKKDVQLDIEKRLKTKIMALMNTELMSKDDDNTEKKEDFSDDICFFLHDNVTYKDFSDIVCNHSRNSIYKFDFTNTNLKTNEIKNNSSLQRANIQVISAGKEFAYPLQYFYRCTRCKKETIIRSCDTVSTDTVIECNGDIVDGEKIHKCKKALKPYSSLNIIKNSYFFEIIHQIVVDGVAQNKTSAAISFNQLMPGFYNAVLYRFGGKNDVEQFHIIDVVQDKSENLEFPKKEEGKNYIQTLAAFFDQYLEKRTGLKIYGLLPVKFSLILQKIMQHIGFPLVYNIHLVGDGGTGKTTTLKYYGYLLNNQEHFCTDANSISIPALRGTRSTFMLLGKEHSYITHGMFGSYKTIYIDEAMDKKELVEDLKSHLGTATYSYSKAYADGSYGKMRTAHINISNNLNEAQRSIYFHDIRKYYNDDHSHIEGHEKPLWDERFDCYKPLAEYNDNPYLRKAVEMVRNKMLSKGQFWIDGQQIPLHERFPFFFYIVDEKDEAAKEEYNKVAISNNSHKIIDNDYELINLLKNTNINKFFDDLKKFHDVNPMKQSDLEKVNQIMKEYGMLKVHNRTKNFYYKILDCSRTLNRRLDCNEEDFFLLRYMIENMEQKIDFIDTNKMVLRDKKINIEEERKMQKMIENAKSQDAQFGLQLGEFE